MKYLTAHLPLVAHQMEPDGLVHLIEAGRSARFIAQVDNEVAPSLRIDIGQEIVEACNSHADLLEALIACVPTLEVVWRQSGNLERKKRLDETLAAIAKATGARPAMTEAEHNASPKGRWT